MPQRPIVKRESRYEYVDKSSGKNLKFTPASDELVATFDESRAAEGVAALSPSSRRRHCSPHGQRVALPCCGRQI
jgi:hypothetical protein